MLSVSPRLVPARLACQRLRHLNSIVRWLPFIRIMADNNSTLETFRSFGPDQNRLRRQTIRPWIYPLTIKLFLVSVFALLSSSPYVGSDRSQKLASTFASVPKNVVPPKSHQFKIRTITSGVNLKNTTDLATIESA